MEPTTSWFLVGFVSAAPRRELPVKIFLNEGEILHSPPKQKVRELVCIYGTYFRQKEGHQTAEIYEENKKGEQNT